MDDLVLLAAKLILLLGYIFENDFEVLMGALLVGNFNGEALAVGVFDAEGALGNGCDVVPMEGEEDETEEMEFRCVLLIREKDLLLFDFSFSFLSFLSFFLESFSNFLLSFSSFFVNLSLIESNLSRSFEEWNIFFIKGIFLILFGFLKAVVGYVFEVQRYENMD